MGIVNKFADGPLREFGNLIALWVRMSSAMSTQCFATRRTPLARGKAPALLVLLVTVALGTASAQTHVVAPTPNKYAPSDDVKVGLEAASQVSKELPMLNDAAT